MTTRTSIFLLSVVATIIFATQGAAETIIIRTGQVNGLPGPIPTEDDVGAVDDCFRYLASGNCCNPLSPVAFGPADFAAADAGPPAELIVPHPTSWIQTLPSDPAARWINWNHGTISPTSGSGRAPESVLYSCQFTLTTPGNPTADITAFWASDDRFGDPLGGPNPVGLYINGTPLNSSFNSTGQLMQSSATQLNVPLNTGANTLYLYQRDSGAAVSGIIFSCTITINSCLLICPLGDGGVIGTGTGTRSPDFNGDMVVNLVDLGLFANCYGSPTSDPCCDLNCDAIVNLVDVGIMAQHWMHAGSTAGMCQ